MKKSFEELYLALKVNREKCHWASKVDIEEYSDELISEIEEVKKAVKNNDMKNLKEEVGDMLWDAIFLAIIAEEKAGFELKEALQGALDKLKRRKSWMFEGKDVTIEEARRIWREAKAKEKNI